MAKKKTPRTTPAAQWQANCTLQKSKKRASAVGLALTQAISWG
jgi:hypothetical protein